MKPFSTDFLVTPSYAQDYLKNWKFDRQRPITRDHVLHLAYEMQNGRFVAGLQIYVCELPDGSRVLVNGQHTLSAIVESGQSIHLTITVQKVSSIDEAGRIYAVFDTQKRRSWGQSARATGLVDGYPSLSKSIAAVGVILRKFGEQRYGAAYVQARMDRFEELVEYREAAQAFYDATKKGRLRPLLQRSGAMAVALETFLHQPSMASEFWGSIAHDETPTGTAAKALKNWLQDTKRTAGEQAQREHVMACASAWNANFRGQLRSFVQPNGMKSFYLLGTPWTVPEGAENAA